MSTSITTKRGCKFELDDYIVDAAITLISSVRAGHSLANFALVLFSGIDLNGRKIVNFGTIPDTIVELLDEFDIRGERVLVAVADDVMRRLDGRSLVATLNGFDIV